MSSTSVTRVPILAAFVLFALLLSTGSGPDRASAAGCANEAVRLLEGSTGLPECRAWEQVSPVDKGGSQIDFGFPQGLGGGDTAVYAAGNASRSSEGAPALSQFASMRSADGWTTRGIDPPAYSESGVTIEGFTTFAVSEDGSHALVGSNLVLAPGAVFGSFNLYLRDLRSGGYSLVAVGTREQQGEAGIGNLVLLDGGSRDFSTILIASYVPFTSQPLPEYTNAIYEYREGRLRLVTRRPNGEPMQGFGSTGLPGIKIEGIGAQITAGGLSADGSRIAFSINESEQGDAGEYVDTPTGPKPISVSRVPGQPTETQPAQQITTSRDGRFVFFLVTSQVPLTADAPEGERNDYRYDTTTGDLAYIDGTGAFARVTEASEDGSTAFIVDERPPGALEAWRDGTTRTILDPFPFGTLSGWYNAGLASSPDGRYVAVDSVAPLTGDQIANGSACGSLAINPQYSGNCPQVYLVDVEAGTTTCVSCANDGGLQLGPAEMFRSRLAGHVAHPVTNAGRVFFSTPNPLVAADANGRPDVYAAGGGSPPQLLSGARTGTDAFLADVGPGARDVLFYTDAPLVSQDVDQQTDVYDARVEGGLLGQNPRVVNAGCAPVSCAAPGAAPAPAAPGTASVRGGGNVHGRTATRKRKLRAALRRCRAKDGKARKRCVAKAHRRFDVHLGSKGGRR